jgi:DNA-binding transcriptional LysR family regulator
MMETEQLRTFRAVLRTGGFTTAARQLGFVQSTVTQHVAALERRFGTRLVDRLPTGAVATDAGTRLLELADSILDLEDRLALEVADAGRTPSGHVRLAAPDSLCAYRLAPLVATMRSELPDIRVTLAPVATRGAVDALRSGDCEAALLLETALREEDLRVKRVGEEALVMVADTPRTRRTWAAMADDDFLLLEEGCCYSDEVERRLQAAGQPPERRLRFGSIEAVKACVAAGMGISVLPRVAVQRELEAGLLATVEGPLPPTPRVFAAVHARRTATAATLTVLERLAKWWRVDVVRHQVTP